MNRLKFAALLIGVLSASLGYCADASAQCHSDLSFLSGRIPSFQNPDIDSVRGAILQSNVVGDMKKASSMGYSPQAAVQASLAQADEYDQSAKQALETSNATSVDFTSDDGFLRTVKAGGTNSLKCDGVNGAAMCAAIVAKLGAIASRAEAAEMGCFIQAGQWPN